MRSNHLVLLILSIIVTSAAASATPLLDRLQHVVDLTESQISQLREAEEHVAAVVRRVELAVRSGSLSPADGRACRKGVSGSPVQARVSMEPHWTVLSFRDFPSGYTGLDM